MILFIVYNLRFNFDYHSSYILYIFNFFRRNRPLLNDFSKNTINPLKVRRVCRLDWCALSTASATDVNKPMKYKCLCKFATPKRIRVSRKISHNLLLNKINKNYTKMHLRQSCKLHFPPKSGTKQQRKWIFAFFARASTSEE